MKKVILLIIVIFSIASCSKVSTFTIEATTDHPENKKVYLIAIGTYNTPGPIDSTNVVNGKFTFKTDSIVIPEMQYVFFENERENIPVVSEPGKIKINIYKDSIRKSKISGTKSNDDFSKYQNETNSFYLEMSKIQREISNITIEESDIFKRDSVITNDLRDQFDLMRSKLNNYEISFMSNNNDSFISALILERMVVQQEIEMKVAAELYDNFTELIKLTKPGEQIKKYVELYKGNLKDEPEIGSIAPDFTGPGLQNEILSLSDVNSKVIMIDFWASWCAPCRVENPFLVYLNTKYSKDEFQVVGVSLDRTREAWENAIKEDKLDDWIHISHLKFWNEPIAKLYNIVQMPTSYILNSEKKILAMNVKDQDLDNLIGEQLMSP